MTIEAIKAYLKENQRKYPQEVLIEELRKAKYPDDEIQEGIREVYGETAAPLARTKKSFWDFRSTRVYHSRGEKIIDFLTGFFAPAIIGYFFIFLLNGMFGILSYAFYGFRFPVFFITPVVIIVAQILGIFYFRKRRQYFSRGLLVNLFLIVVAIGFMVFGVFVLFRGGGFY